MEKDKNVMWINVLNWMTSELLGEEIFLFFANHKFSGRPIADDETSYATELSQFEKRLYDLVDAVHVYLKENGYRLPRGEGDQKLSIGNALRQIFWSVIKLNHPELLKNSSSIGIRSGYSIVELPCNEPKIQDFLKGFVKDN